MQIKGKVALVLGAVKGIGKGIGLALANEGAKLIVTRHDWEDSFDSMEKDFSASKAEHLIITANLRSIKDIEMLASRIEEKYGRLDILINNIERGGWPTVHGEYVEDQWDLEIETTLKAKRWVFTSVFPLLKKAKEAVVRLWLSIYLPSQVLSGDQALPHSSLMTDMPLPIGVFQVSQKPGPAWAHPISGSMKL